MDTLLNEKCPKCGGISKIDTLSMNEKWDISKTEIISIECFKCGNSIDMVYEGR